MTPGGRVVIGVGNEYRRDDGFGPAVVARLAALRESDPRLASVELAVSDGEPTRLLDLWTGADLAVVIDAVRDPDGSVGRRYEVAAHELGELADERAASSHGLSLGSAAALGRALDRLPRHLVALAVSGREFGLGVGLTPELAAAVEPVVARVRALLDGPS
jgi:hydrogenase maturation protease